MVSSNSECDELVQISHSDKVTPKNIVFFADCKNGKRFYFSEKDINNKNTIQSIQSKFEQMKFKLVNTCDAIVKTHLTHPQTFDKSIFSSGYQIFSNSMVITVGFSAKNSFNMELDYTAQCYFDTEGKLTDFKMYENN
jgi:hypothetical protein